MNKYSSALLCILLFTTHHTLPSLKIIDYLKSYGTDTAKKLILTSVQERKELLERLQAEEKKLKESEKEYNDRIQTLIDDINEQINTIKEELQKGNQETETDFLNKQLTLLNEIYQNLFNLQLSRKEQLSIVEQHIKLQEEYLKDPDYSNISTKPHAFYTYQNYSEQNKKISTQEERIAHLLVQKNEALLELENLTRKLNTIKKDYQEKKKEQDAFSAKLKESSQEDANRKKGIIIDLEARFFSLEIDLLEQKIEFINKKISYLNTANAMEAEKLRILKSDLTRIRNALRIDQKDIQELEEQADKFKAKSIKTRDFFYQNIKELSTQKESLTKELEQIKKNYENIEIITSANLNDWIVTPKTVQEFIAICEIGFKQEQIDLIDNIIDHLRAQIDLEKSSYQHEEINLEILKEWFKITRRKFANKDEIAQDLKRFQLLLAESKREENTIKDRRNNATNGLNINNKSLLNLKSLINNLKLQREKIFKQAAQQFTFCMTRLGQSYTLIEDQVRSITNIIKTYNNHISIIESNIQDLSGVMAELETKSIWQRSEYAISWEGITNITPDIRLFSASLLQLASNFFSHLTIASITQSISDLFKTSYDWIIFFIRLLIIIGLFFLLRTYLPSLAQYIHQKKSTSRLISFIYNLSVCIINFIWTHLLSIYIWVILLMLVTSDFISSTFLHITFYLVSIFYLCYLTYRFILFIIACNAQNNYALFNQQFEPRFKLVFSLFGYLTVILLLFRQAFILTTYHVSELPTIILASYSIFIRILIIFSIGKDEILSLIPTKNDFGKAIADFINRYYILLLLLIIIIMIMSDPYVGGYSNLVSYIIWGTLGTFILFKGLRVIQSYIRQSISHIFFTYDDDTLKERFSHARTWYGLFVISLFICAAIIGIIFFLRIWGYPINTNDIAEAFKYHILTLGPDEYITPLTILGMMAFIASGFFIAFAVNHFVIRNIFTLLPVNIGIQNTVMSIVRYLIIFSTLLLSFYWGNLTFLIIAIGVVIGSIGYIVKEPIADFVSYFIILVQRPVKIGDYIVLDELNSGLVRHITPRSVILRSKNSFSVIVPNSTIISRVVKNWNYSGVFAAFDDIQLTIPYQVDPQRVREIALKILDENPEILKNPKPIVRLDNFGDHGYVFTIRGFISGSKTLEMWNIASDVRFALVKALQENKIPIAYPARVMIQKSEHI